MEMFERGWPGCVLTRIQQLIRDFDARADEATTIARIRGKMSEFANYHARPRHPRDDLETRRPGEGNEIQKAFSSDKAARCIPAVGMETKGNKEMRIAIADGLAGESRAGSIKIHQNVTKVLKTTKSSA